MSDTMSGVLLLLAWLFIFYSAFHAFREVDRDIRVDEAAREQRGLP